MWGGEEEGEVKGDAGMEMGSKENRKAGAHHTHHTHTHTRAELTGCTVLQRWVTLPVSRWGKKKKQTSFPLSGHAVCQTGLLYFCCLLDTRRLFKHTHTHTPAHPEGYPTFPPLFCSLLLLLLQTPFYLFTAGRLFLD